MATTTFFGTLEYSPPEFFLKQEYSGQSDLWAFGCLLYEFVVGVVPFLDLKGSKRNTIHRILRKCRNFEKSLIRNYYALFEAVC